jgi:hypothetical protein
MFLQDLADLATPGLPREPRRDRRKAAAESFRFVAGFATAAVRRRCAAEVPAAICQLPPSTAQPNVL